MSREQFRSTFVDSLSSLTRTSLYQQLSDYTAAFSAEVVSDFAQWIGGSFTTAKRHPRDIDLLTILWRSDFEAHHRLIEREFTRNSALYAGVDAYFLPVPATGRDAAPLYRLDRLYWEHQFGYTRRDRRGRRHPRGYIEFIHNDFRYDQQ